MTDATIIVWQHILNHDAVYHEAIRIATRETSDDLRQWWTAKWCLEPPAPYPQSALIAWALDSVRWNYITDSLRALDKFDRDVGELA